MATKTKAKARPAGDPAALAQAAEGLKSLAHSARLRLVQLLPHGRYTVGELAEDCRVPDNVASEHLRLMQRCGFFTSQRESERSITKSPSRIFRNIMKCVGSRFLAN